MLQRCRNPKDRSYPNYGGRGITVCRRWLSFSNFFADLGLCPSPGLTIERSNNCGNYEPSNVCWANRLTQNNNRRSCKTVSFGKTTGTMKQVWRAEAASGISYRSFTKRLQDGWSVDRALTVPPIKLDKLTARDKERIRELRGIVSQPKLAKMFGVTKSLICWHQKTPEQRAADYPRRDSWRLAKRNTVRAA
jgi:hypothetical protein